ncbi:MAG: EamA family transporter [Paracoccaceae bacterium]
MLSLSLGLLAALFWAVHDLLVRKMAQDAAILPMLLVVFAVGAVALLGPVLVIGGWERMGLPAVLWAAAAGAAYVMGAGALYRAFGMAPVRIVAPVIGAYPMLSLAIAAMQGRAVGLVEWLAVGAIVGGISWVALTGRGGEIRGGLLAALAWAGLAAVGFAATFAFGQEAARLGAAFPAMLVTRVVAVAGVVVLAVACRSVRPAPGTTGLLALMGVLDAFALGAVMAAGSLPHPEYAAVASALFGVLTILLAWRVLGETVAPIQWAGIAAIFAGVAVLSLLG